VGAGVAVNGARGSGRAAIAVGWVRPKMRMRAKGLRNEDSRLIYFGLLVGLLVGSIFRCPMELRGRNLGSTPKLQYFGYAKPKIRRQKPGTKTKTCGPETIVTKFLGRWGRGTGSRYVVRYLREIFTRWVENELVNPGQGRRTWVEGRRW
jgi:hypothetical protein